MTHPMMICEDSRPGSSQYASWQEPIVAHMDFANGHSALWQQPIRVLSSANAHCAQAGEMQRRVLATASTRSDASETANTRLCHPLPLVLPCAFYAAIRRFGTIPFLGILDSAKTRYRRRSGTLGDLGMEICRPVPRSCTQYTDCAPNTRSKFASASTRIKKQPVCLLETANRCIGRYGVLATTYRTHSRAFARVSEHVRFV